MQTRSRRRARWLIWGAVAILAALGATYVYVTNPDRLRAQALTALGALPIPGINVAEVAFSPTDGLQITNLTVPAPVATGRGPTHAPPLLHIAHTAVACDPLALLVGQLRPTCITLDGATLSLICGRDAAGRPEETVTLDAASWQRLATLLRGPLPRVEIARVDLQLIVPEQGRAQVFQRWPLSASGQSTAFGYRLRVDQIPAGLHPVAELRWMRATGDVELSADWGTLDTLRPALPRELLRALERLNLDGRARVERLAFHLPTTPEPAAATGISRLAAAEVHLEALRCAVPLEADTLVAADGTRRPAPSARFLQLADTAAKITYQRHEPGAPGRLRVRAEGRLNDAPLRLNLVTEADLLPRLWQCAACPTPGGLAPLSLADIVLGELHLEGFELPTEQTAPAFIHSPLLIGPVSSTFEDYAPAGRVDITTRILPLGAAASPDWRDRLELLIDSRGARCRYHGFPYDFEDARGQVYVTRGRILLKDLCARHGAGWACVNGEINSTASWTGFDLTFRGTNTALEGNLYAALPPEYRHLWENASPVGLCDIVAHVSRPEGTPETGPARHQVIVDADLLAGSLTLTDGRRLTRADGRFTIRADRIDVHDLHGYDGTAAFRLNGQVGTRADSPSGELHLVVDQLPVDYSAALTTQSGGPPQQVRFVGHADVQGRIYQTAGGQQQQHHAAVHITDGQLSGFDPARTWTDGEGWVIVRDDVERILSFTCRQGDAVLNASGVLPHAGETDRSLALDLRADTPSVRELLPQFVPQDWSELAEDLGLEGPGTIQVRLQPEPGTGAEAAQTARIVLQADAMKARPMPLELHQISADLTLGPGFFELRSSRAHWGQTGNIEASARGSWGKDTVDAHAAVTASGLTFCPELVAGLPKPLADVLAKLGPGGDFDAYLPQIRVRGGPPRDWHIEGRLPFRNTKLQIGLELTELEGVLFGTCTFAADADTAVDAEFEIQRGRIAGRALEDWKGQLYWRPDDGLVRLLDMHGRLCGGEAVGKVTIDPRTEDFDLSLALREVSVSELFPPPKDGKEHKDRGRLDGRIYLRGHGADVGSRLGGGDVRIRGGSFLHTPVLASVAEAGTPENVPINDTVDQADIRFLWEGSLLRLLRVEIESADLRMVGEGEWNMRDDTIKMRLVGAHPRNWQRIPVLTDLVETAGQKLVQYEVQGPLNAPEVTAKPLYRIDEALRALLGQQD